MPKHEFLTPKAIGNRIKSKGLQKLRWYCQMCQKQCRDENGYKCHIMSESHQRQLLLVAENPGRFVGGFSSEFLKGFMDILRRQYGTRRILANSVYQEYIKDKDHYHMNATRWSTLSGFCMYLGRNGLVDAEPTPKGWYITYVDRSPEAMARQAAEAKKKKMDRDDEERSQKMVEEQIVRALEAKMQKGDDDDDDNDDDTDTKYSELERRNDEEKITLKLFEKSQSSTNEEIKSSNGLSNKTTIKPDMPPPSSMPSRKQSTIEQPLNSSGLTNALKLAEKEAKMKTVKREERKRKLPTSAVEEIFKMEDAKREKRNRKDYWLHEDIVVKVVHDKLGEKYYKRKGVVEEIRDTYTAIVTMLDSNDKIKIDQSHLETVIPGLGKQLLIVNGAFRGCRATLESLDMKNYCVSVKIGEGPSRGRTINNIPYEDVSKLYNKDYS